MLLVGILFIVVFASVLGSVAAGTAYFRSKQKQQIRSMLQRAEETPRDHVDAIEYIRPADIDDFLARVLRRFAFMDRLDLILEQAGKNWTASKFITVSCVTGLLGVLIGLKLRLVSAPVSASLLGCLGALAPLFLVMRKRSKAISAFEEQFPDALDFLSRSMRAGHGFSVAMEMLSTDSPEPLCSAFRRVSNDMQLGSSLDVAFGKLVVLVPLVDVRFFVSSVILQQETGGNLGEILSKLAAIIRDRFRLKGQVKAAAAHGKITGLVLVLMPVAVVGFMSISSPAYLRQLVADPIGRLMIYGAVIGQAVGYLVIQKIVNIKV
jgi:tight adherence protein B